MSSLEGPRRLPRVTHFCSAKVTHTENSIWRRNRPDQAMGRSSIIHAGGVLTAAKLVLAWFGLPARAPQIHEMPAPVPEEPKSVLPVGKLHHLGAVVGHSS